MHKINQEDYVRDIDDLFKFGAKPGWGLLLIL